MPCNTVPMAAACATAAGHIFLGGTDGNVYQLQYGKRQSCRLACVSRSFLSMLGAGMLPGYLATRIWSTVPVRLMVADDARHVLYTLSENHTIRVRPLPPPLVQSPCKGAHALPIKRRSKGCLERLS